jgi:hypothetical protein
VEHEDGRFALCEVKSSDDGFAHLQHLAEEEGIEALLQFVCQVEGSHHLFVEVSVRIFDLGLPVHYFLKGVSPYT